jgi:hypothetical protein
MFFRRFYCLDLARQKPKTKESVNEIVYVSTKDE